MSRRKGWKPLHQVLPLQHLKLKSLGLFPGKDVAAEMSVGGSLLEDGVLHLEILDNAAGSQVEVVLHNVSQLLASFISTAVVCHCD